MRSTLEKSEPIIVSGSEESQVRALARILRRRSVLVTSSEESVELSSSLRLALTQIVEILSTGQSVQVTPEKQVVTTQQAATMLGMSRPYFIKLLENGAMAYHRVGNQRRVSLQDVVRYAQKRDEDRKAALKRLSRNAMELGLYDRVIPTEPGTDE